MSVLFLEVIDSFKIAIKVVSGVVPRITRVMDVLVGPYIREKHFT